MTTVHDGIVEHYNYLYHLLLSKLKDETLAEDIAQEVVLRCLERAHLFEEQGTSGSSSLRAWVLTVGMNTMRNRVRQLKNRRAKIRNHPDRLPQPSPAQSPDEIAQCRDIDPYLNQITEDCVILRKRAQGWKHREIAEETGIPVGTSLSQLCRTRARLRKDERLRSLARDWGILPGHE